MTQPEFYELMEKFNASALTRLEYEEGGRRIVLEKGGLYAAASAPAPGAPPAAIAPPPQAETAQHIRTPLVGTFYAAPEPGKPPFVSPGDTVKKGQIVCIIEAMKMINEVPAPCDCIIEKALLKDGSLAGFDEPLFEIRGL